MDTGITKFEFHEGFYLAMKEMSVMEAGYFAMALGSFMFEGDAFKAYDYGEMPPAATAAFFSAKPNLDKQFFEQGGKAENNEQEQEYEEI